MKEKFKVKILNLNLAYKKIREGLKILDKLYKNNNDVRYYYWKLNKINDQMNKKIMKLIQQENVEDEWKKLVKRLKKDQEKKDD